MTAERLLWLIAGWEMSRVLHDQRFVQLAHDAGAWTRAALGLW